MARRGTSKDRSVVHEDFIASCYGGVRSPSSGGADTDQGDVRTNTHLIECKTTGGPGKPKCPTYMKIFEKIALEAFSEAKEPVLAMRFYNPESVIADSDGWVDVVIRTVSEDRYRA